MGKKGSVVMQGSSDAKFLKGENWFYLFTWAGSLMLDECTIGPIANLHSMSEAVPLLLLFSLYYINLGMKVRACILRESVSEGKKDGSLKKAGQLQGSNIFWKNLWVCTAFMVFWRYGHQSISVGTHVSSIDNFAPQIWWWDLDTVELLGMCIWSADSLFSTT